MIVGTMRLELHIPEANSLKAKRSVVSSLKARIKSKFNVSIAEVGNLDLWQRATLGVAIVTNERRFADEVLSQVANAVSSEPRVQILDQQISID